ncbi:hypothetical protein HPB51_006948 [Rhipicephalus microplus]|uniref:Uncharacterized protein n=1 Tax=Rhipicephalus microplus TaxID=6941 RepID=A0A9J6DTJ7_RHIMP|nr:hypothetical protein HPB51_006948 [Rhipicephalus microplus]
MYSFFSLFFFFLAAYPTNPLKTKIKGLTGNVSFDDRGFRVNYTIDVVEMTINSEMVKIAEWSDLKGLKLSSPKYRRVYQDTGFESNKTYIVTSILVRGRARFGCACPENDAEDEDEDEEKKCRLSHCAARARKVETIHDDDGF